MKTSKLLLTTVCMGLLFAVAGCNSTSSPFSKKASKGKSSSNGAQVSALEGVNSEDAAAVAEENTELAKVVRKKGTVANRGGYIKILVNREPITNFEIQRRAKFLRVRRVGGNRTQKAEKELIEQALKLSESKRLRTIASDEQVNEAFARFAKSNKVSTKQLSRELGQLGVGASHFKEFIRTQISWNRSLQRYYQAKNSQKAIERDVVTGLRKSGGEKPELTEYAFKRVVFVVPKAKRSASLIAARKREAQAFRQRFPGCEGAVQAIKSLRDVSIVNQQRVLEPEIPERWKKSVANPGVNNTTSLVETNNGVEFLAICSKKQVNDDRAAVVAQQAKGFTDLNQKSTQLEKDYLDQLRKSAVIVYQ